MSFQKLSIYQNGVLVNGDITFDSNGQAVITVKYESDVANTTGVGFALSFDSSALSLDGVSNVFAGAIAPGDVNSTGDGLDFGWASLFGQFPGSNEADLATITFNNIGGSASAPMPSMTFTSTAAGFEGQIGNPVQLDPLEITTYDIDENSGAGQVIATVDNAADGETFAFAGGEAVSEVSEPEQASATQHVYVSESTKSDDGTQVTVTLSYKSDEANTTGVGFSLNFDNSVLSLNNVSGVFAGAIASGDVNSDGNGLDFGWASLFGQFPGSNTAELATITFDVADGATGSTGLEIEIGSAAAGFAFDGQPHEVVITAEAGDPSLSIDSATGEVTLLVDPNFEDVSEYSFDIVSSSGRTASDTSNINNLDEAAPTITSGSDAGSVDENGAAQVVYTATADDSGDISGGVTFSLLNDSDGAFSIDAASGDVTFAGGADYETQSEYSFSVVATDAAGNESVPEVVTLVVENVDDSAPAITSDANAGSIDENSGAGQVIYTASAIEDNGDVQVGPISYSLADGSDAGLSINSVTGEVSLNADPDADTKSVYNFAVIATDGAGNASAAKSVTVDINNLDDTAPVIISDSVAAEIEENSGAGQLVYTAVADDSADVSGGIVYSLSGADADAFSIDENSGEVVLIDDPDYEAKSSYEFDVVATDAANNSSSKSVTLPVGNVNDFKPVFNLPISGNIDENSGSGNDVLTVVATPDPDVSELYPITYTLEDGSDAALSIDSATGVVSLNEDPDFETQNSYVFSVLATDAAGNSSYAPGLVSVNNLDEVAPTITSVNTVEAVDENDDAQAIYAASADDSNDVSAGVTFSLAAGSDSALSIDAVTGVVSIDTSADHEVQAVYSFGVIATDAAGNASETTSLILTINDLDDAAPSIDSSGSADSVDENATPGQVVYTATADDSVDDVADGPIVFSLTDDSDGEFSINASSGEVSFNATADHEADSEYSFFVVATDGAGNVGQPKQVTMNIVDLDDSAPSVTSGDSAISVDENAQSGQVVYAATADDSGDDVSDGPVTFSLTDDSDSEFSINASTGEVAFNATADHEADSEYSFSVVATDAAGNAGAPQLVTMAVNDLDELPPVITAPTVNKVLSAFTGAGQTIYTPNVVDNADDVTSGPLSYSLTSGDPALFEIDPATGIVTYLPNPQTDLDTEYLEYQVTVEDGSGNKSSVNLTLEIAGKEENAPLIYAPDGEVTYQILSEGKVVQNKDTENEFLADVVTAVVGNIDESVSAGTVIYNLNHYDATGTSFSLIDSTGDLEIDEFGNVSITKQAEFERHDQYNFTVVVTDASGNESRQDVRLLVSNLSVEENADTDQVVYMAAADFNALGDKELTYSLDSQNDSALVIDKETGVVSYLATPDYEAGSTLDFVVASSDGNTRSVSISINNIDDNAPLILSSNSVSSIDENTGAGQVVYASSADDSLDSSGAVTFSLSDDSDSALSIDDQGVVTLNENPNHEAQSSYSFTVVASDDSGNESRQALTLEINDKDEIAPVFLSSGTANLDENSVGELVIYKSSAHSAESVIEQGAISQEIVRNDDGTITVRLFVDSSVRSDYENGLATAEFNLGYESEDANSLSINGDIVIPANTALEAVNSSSNGQINFALLYRTEEIKGSDEVSVYDVNGEEAIAEVTFNVGNPDAISTFTVSDVGLMGVGSEDIVFHDQTVNEYAVNDGGRVEYSLAASGDSDLLTIDSVTGEVSIVAGSDAGDDSSGDAIEAPESQANTQQVYVSESVLVDNQLTLTIAYQADVANTTGIGFSVDFDTSILSLSGVSNVFAGAIASGEANADGNSLDFGWASLFTQFPGSTNADLAVITFDVIDSSSAPSISITPASSAAGFNFEGSSFTHEVSLSGVAIDYEEKQEFNFTVIATDESGVSSEEAVSVAVNNLDEVAPTITSDASTVSVDENNAPKVIYTATADDSGDTSDGFTFALSESSDPALSINADTGEVTLNASADHESQSEYSFEVIATDAAGNASDAQAVTLTINDLDDTADVITSGDSAAAIDENSGEGQVIYTVTSEDLVDNSENVTYHLSEDSDAALSIDAETGEVILNADPDHEAQAVYSFGVFATDGAGNVSETQSVSLAVNDLDDSAPVITSSDVLLAVDEANSANSEDASGQIIYTAIADDSADISDGVTFSLAGEDASAFSIDVASGEVSLQDNPDYEVKTSYAFTVVTTDAAGNTASKDVELLINNVDEVGPTITSSASAGSINENTGVDQVVYTATATDSDYNGSEEITFSLSDDSTPGLAIDANTGVVTLLKNPDYESAPEAKKYSFNVIATDASGNSDSQLVELKVDPVTEVYVTYWGSNVRVAGVKVKHNGDEVAETKGSENVFIGKDFREGGIDVEKDVSHQDLKEVINTADAMTILQMVVASRLDNSIDYSNDEMLFTAANFAGGDKIDSDDALNLLKYVVEEDTSYGPAWEFFDGDQERAGDYDSGSEDTAGYIAVVRGDVNKGWSNWAQSKDGATDYVRDADVIAPEMSSKGEVDIDAGIAAGKVVYTAVATDGEGKKVFYSLEGAPEGVSIDEHTGDVILASDTQENDTINFTVNMRDQDGNDRSEAVTLNVSAIPDTAAPVITSSAEETINENLETNVIYTAQATDAYGSDITFSLGRGSDPALSIDSSSGEVTLSEDADSETQSAYKFILVATDTAGNSSREKVVVSVSDLDEVAPKITSGDKAATIDENSGAGQVVYRATADDSGDISAGVTFSLAGEDAAAFEINADSGVVTLIADPDHEDQSAYSFIVIVDDGVKEPVEQAVTLDINDLDEADPTVTSADSAATIDENSGAGQVVYTATATDDADISGGVSFSLAGDDAGAFKINAKSGEVALAANPDHESQASYSFSVVATDAAGNSSEQSVSLSINDLDEVAATITVTDAVTELDENSGAGAVILNVSADDSADTSDGVVLELAGADADAFTLANGQVTLNDDLDHEAQSSYSFSVVATDAAGNSSKVSHTLSVNDLDEVAPSFTSDSNVSIVENSAAGQVVYVNEASDDRDASDGLSYSLSIVNQDVPQLEEGIQSVYVSRETLNPNLDPNQLELTVTYLADSNQLPGLGLNVHFDSSVLSVADINDVLSHDLIFTQDEAQADTDNLDGNDATDSFVSVGWASLDGDWTSTGLPENLLTMVFDITGDASGSTEIGFSSSSTPVGYEFNAVGYAANSLSINEDSGDVTLNVSPDYEAQSEYNFTLSASDGIYSVDQDVTLSVINVDDTRPAITSDDIAVSVDENSGGKVIYSTQSDDSADVSVGRVTYSLADGHDASIEISAETGDVYLLEDPDHETQSSYSFSVIATDSTGREITKDVNLTINDLDDTADVITSGDTAAAIDENSGDAQVIYTATSEDLVDNSVNLVYSLAEGSDEALSINSETGEVTLNTNPDHETQTEYSFGVFVTDGAGNVSETQQVTLDINDLDDSADVITSSDSAGSIDENSGDAQVIYTVTSEDLVDNSENVTYHLAEGSEAFSINVESGEVSLNASPDFEAQSEYSFGVYAVDGAGNVSDTQVITLGINNVDETAPTITSGDIAGLVEAGTEDEVIYTATADDSADVSGGVTFSLADAGRTDLSIDSGTGEVSLAEGADPAGYDFTVVATDDAGNSSEQSVSMAVYQAVAGSQPTSGLSAISQNYTHNADGTISLSLVFDKDQASQFVNDDNISLDVIDNIDFDLSYDVDAVSNLQISAPADPTFYFANEVTPGNFEVSQLYFLGHDAESSDALLQLTFDLAEGAVANFTVSNALVNADTSIITDGVDSSVSVSSQEGTSGDDVFELGAGYSNVYTGEGVDTLIVTDETDSSVVVDFDSGSDKFDMAQLLSDAGYGADSDLDGVFGGNFDDETSVLSFTIDNAVVAEVTLSEGSEFDDDDLSADFSAFIA